MWSTARLFVHAAWDAGGAEAVTALDDDLSGDFPVVDAVVHRVLATGGPLPTPDVRPLVERCRGLRRLLVVGVEAAILSPLLAALPDEVEVFVLLDGTFAVDLGRMKASWTPRATLLDLGALSQAAGSRSGLLTAIYGADDFRAVVVPTWVRLHGPDVRMLFRRLVGVNVLGPRMASFPRWLTETARDDFTDVVELA